MMKDDKAVVSKLRKEVLQLKKETKLLKKMIIELRQEVLTRINKIL